MRRKNHLLKQLEFSYCRKRYRELLDTKFISMLGKNEHNWRGHKVEKKEKLISESREIYSAIAKQF